MAGASLAPRRSLPVHGSGSVRRSRVRLDTGSGGAWGRLASCRAARLREGRLRRPALRITLDDTPAPPRTGCGAWPLKPYTCPGRLGWTESWCPLGCVNRRRRRGPARGGRAPVWEPRGRSERRWCTRSETARRRPPPTRAHSAGATTGRSILPKRTRIVPPTIAAAPSNCSQVGISASISQAMTSATTGMKFE